MKAALLIFIQITIVTSVWAQNLFPVSGNVGIGTNTPSYLLDVQDAGSNSPNIRFKGNANLFFGGGNTVRTWRFSKVDDNTLSFTWNNNMYGGDRPVLRLYSVESSWGAYFGTIDPLLFGNANMKINGTLGAGNIVVGVGASTSMIASGSGYVLVANGKIGAREVVVSTATPFPDYVFNSKYKLLTLQETEAYIKENSRLPKMPSAIDVEKKGMELGELNILLVEKIEELTLHIIELNKRLEKLEGIKERE